MVEGLACTHRMEGWAVVGEREPMAADQGQTLLLLLLLLLFRIDKLIRAEEWMCR